jgi:hypothetical protein
MDRFEAAQDRRDEPEQPCERREVRGPAGREVLDAAVKPAARSLGGPEVHDERAVDR